MRVRFMAVLFCALAVGFVLTACETGYPLPEEGYLNETIEPCVPLDESSVEPCEPDVGLRTTVFTSPTSSWIENYDRPFTVRELLDGTSVLDVAHFVLRGTFITDTARCTADNPFRAPSYMDVDAFASSIAIQCYIDVRANGYLVGNGPTEMTVLVSYLHYWDGYYAPVDEGDPTEEEAVEKIRSAHLFVLENAPGLYGREAVLFLGPAHNQAYESWQLYSLWDVQTQDDGTVIAVHPDRDAWQELKPTEYQTYKADLEMSLDTLEERLTTANNDRMTENNDKIGPSDKDGKRAGATLPELRTDATGLNEFYRDTGAYSDPNNPPKSPPPACGLMPGLSSKTRLRADCTALLEGEDTLKGAGTLNWDTGTAIGSWNGITTAGDPSRVTKLELPNKSMTGSIPEELRKLTGLTHLDLSGNSLTGEIPKELERLEALVSLKLSGNSFTGCIPVALGDVETHDLAELNLAYCSPPSP